MRAHLPSEVRLPVVSSKINPSLRPSTAYVMVMLAQPVSGEVLQSTMVYVCMYVYLRVYIRCMLYVLYVLCMYVSTNVSTKSSFTISLLEFESGPSILEDDIVPGLIVNISPPRLWWTVCAGLVPR